MPVDSSDDTNMKAVDENEARAHLSSLLERVAAGEEIVISKAGQPIARLVPIRDRGRNRKPGQDEGRVRIADDFDEPLPPEVQSSFD